MEVALGSSSGEEIHQEVQRILACDEFDASERNRRFLKYVVDETLKGRANRVKAYSIATEVFGRSASFDPQTDPIVRIEASRLRRSLERYYFMAGRTDPIRIVIPKGSYVPSFYRTEWREAPQAGDFHTREKADDDSAKIRPQNGGASRLFRPALLAAVALIAAVLAGVSSFWFNEFRLLSRHAADKDAANDAPIILVVPFEDESLNGLHPNLARAFTREVLAALTRFSEFRVYSDRISLRSGHEPDLPALVRELGVNYIVTGGVASSSDRIRVVASLTNAKTGQVLWSDKFEAALNLIGLLKMESDISGQIAERLASRYGVIFSEIGKEIRGKSPRTLSSYECVLNFYHYWQRPTPALFGPAYECLERTVRDDPQYAEAHSSLALIYVDAYRVGIDRGKIKVEPLPRALELSQRAVDIAPFSVQSRRALYLTYWFMQDIPRALEEAERAVALNPNESEVLADVGTRFCLNNQWGKGYPLVKQAFDRNPMLPGQFRFPFFLRAYLDGRYVDALREAMRINIPDVIYTHLALAAAYGQLGQKQKAGKALDQVLRFDPAYATNYFADMRKRNIHPDIARALVEGLRKAGLNVPTS